MSEDEVIQLSSVTQYSFDLKTEESGVFQTKTRRLGYQHSSVKTVSEDEQTTT